MRTLRLLLSMARADFLQRSRTSAYLFTIAISIYAAHGFLPANGSAYVTLQMDGWRGLYNSAWVGATVALLASTFLSLVGFYLVKNAVTRDRTTRVGEILAATPLPRVVYTIGKTLSNFMVLATMAGVMAVAAGLVQVLRAEDVQVDLWQLVMPFVVLTLPAMLLTAAIAVLFETIPALSGGGGNIAYFFLWTALLVAGGSVRESLNEPARDWLGHGAVLPGMLAAAADANPAHDPDSARVSMGLTFREGGWDLQTFRWEGNRWTGAAIAGRFVWVFVALGIAVAAALPFDRFDPSRREGRKRAAPRAPPPWMRSRQGADAAPRPASPIAGAAHLPPATRAGAAGIRPFWTFLGAELRLALRDRGRWWFIVLAGLTIAALALPIEIARGRILPLLWVWPILVWSPMGTREAMHRTDQVLFAAPHPIGMQLAASWAVGCLIAMISGAAIGLRLVLAGDLAGLAAWGVGAAFIPALALAFGIWTRTPRTFEAIYLVWWYAGPLQPVPPLDFMGASPETVAAGIPVFYAGAALALYFAAVLGRAVRLRA